MNLGKLLRMLNNDNINCYEIVGYNSSLKELTLKYTKNDKTTMIKLMELKEC